MVREPRVPDEAAREILRRAAEIDRVNAESMSLETLRAAAREAGIAEASIEAALTEHAQQQSLEVRPTPTVPRRRVIAAVVAVVALLIGGFVFMRLVAPIETRTPAPTTAPTPAPTPPPPQATPRTITKRP